ncbi:MAG: hypothetical protein RLZZ86_682 [Cyanobacteriota bacterium]
MQIKTFIFAVSLSFISTVNIPVFAQVRVIPTLPTNKIEEQEKISNIKKLLDITGFKNIARLETIKLRDSFKAKYPQIPAKFLDAFLAELKLEEIVDIAFYETPLGKYYLTVGPQISNEAEEIGRKHGIRAMQRALQKLKLEGLKSAGYVTPH